jgi:uncharacterized iron-regulated membrane protein
LAVRSFSNLELIVLRQWHRWLAALFGVFLLWISATGVLSQIGSIANNGLFEADQPRSAPATPPGFTCPETMTCRPKPAKPQAWNVGLLHHLHSGESFGPAGTIVSLLSGLALFFFAFSGLWMYIQMWRGRLVKTGQGKAVRGGRFFW